MSLQNLATQMAAQGRGPDRTLVHMSPREVEGLQALAMAHGGSLTINPETGLPEAGFLESILPAVAGFALNAFAPGVGTAVGGMLGLGEAAGTALTVGGIAGLASGSLEKGIMAGMGAYGGAGLAGSLMNPSANAAVLAAENAIPGGGPLPPEAVAAARQGVNPMDSLKSGFSAAASNPKDFLQDNKYLLGAALLPALAGGLGDSGEGTGAPKTPKYIRRYETDPVTGEIRQAQAVSTDDFGDQSAVSFGGVPKRMADGGPVSFGGVPASTKVIDPYDTRTDSQKAMAYLMGEANATNPMLFTHKQATGPIEPADMLTRKGGRYILDSATNAYVWVPDDTAAADAAAASLAAKAGLAALNNRGGGRGEPAEPGYEAPSTQSFAEGLASAGVNYGNALGGFLPGGFVAKMLGNAYIDSRLSDAALNGGYTGTYTGDAAFGDRPNNTMTEAQTQAAIAGTGGGPLSGEAWGGGFAQGDQGNSGGNFSGGFNNSDSGGSNAGAAARGGDGFGGTGSGIGGGDGGGMQGNSGGNFGGGFGDGGGDAKGGFYKNGKFNFHPAKVYAEGGIAALAGGGLGSLGGYSDGGQLLKGPGDGVSDSIPAKIAGNQPARLADGEFVVPARIVSEIGNGSTDAGARELYKMMARIQAGRKKTVGKNKVAVNSKSARHLPA